MYQNKHYRNMHIKIVKERCRGAAPARAITHKLLGMTQAHPTTYPRALPEGVVGGT